MDLNFCKNEGSKTSRNNKWGQLHRELQGENLTQNVTKTYLADADLYWAVGEGSQ